MEGSPVRGQHRTRIAQLNHAQTLQSFQTELVRLLSAEIPHAEFFFGAVDASPDRPQLPSWVRAYLERDPDPYKRLERGDRPGPGGVKEVHARRPATAGHASAVLIPVINDGVLHGAIGAV